MQSFHSYVLLGVAHVLQHYTCSIQLLIISASIDHGSVQLCVIELDCMETRSYGDVNSSSPSATYMRQWIGSTLVQIMAFRFVGAKPISEPMLEYC